MITRFLAPVVLLLLLAVSCTAQLNLGSPSRSLQFLSGSESARKLIIFVHGVTGDSLTWKNAAGPSWPDLMNGDDEFRNYRLATYRYDSPVLDRTSTIEEVSTRMLQQLHDEGVFRNYEEIYFITHSMGGLVTKRVLVKLNAPERIDSLRRVKAVLYIATPAQGADIADLGTWLSLNPQFRDIQSANFNSYLQGLENEWGNLIRQRGEQRFPLSFCAYETKRLRWAVVVSRVSATTYCDDTPIPIDEDHISIVKPGSTGSPIYQWARGRIQEASEIARGVPSVASVQKRFDEQLRRNEFLLERGKQIATATFVVQLKRPYTREELGHYRLLLQVMDLDTGGKPQPTLSFAAQNANAGPLHGTTTHVWSRNPDLVFPRRVFEADGTLRQSISRIRVEQTINRRGPFQTLESLNLKHLFVFISESLADKLEAVGFAVDGYLLMGVTMKCLDQEKRSPFEPWPIPLPTSEQDIGWLHLQLRRYWPGDTTYPPYRPNMVINFERFTPPKADPRGEWDIPLDCVLSEVGPPPRRDS